VKRAAVIGAGYIAREHLDCLRSLASVDIVGICDLSPTLAQAAAEEFQVPHWYTDSAAMLRELAPEVVHVTTPPGSHVLLARQALEAGAHVLVEKPITFDRDELRRLQQLAASRGLVLLEDHNYLFNDSVERIREQAKAGRLGEVVHVDVIFAVDILGEGSPFADPDAPHPSLSLPGGAVADFVTHLAYLAYAFVGPPRAVHTVWDKRGSGPVPPWDEFRALVDAERGTASLSFSARAQPDLFWLRVHGTRMRATASLFEPLLVFERLYQGPRPLFPVRNGLAAAVAYSHSAVAGLWRKLGGRPITYSGLWRLLSRFYRALEEGAPPPLSPDWIEAVNRLVGDLVAQKTAQ